MEPSLKTISLVRGPTTRIHVCTYQREEDLCIRTPHKQFLTDYIIMLTLMRYARG